MANRNAGFDPEEFTRAARELGARLRESRKLLVIVGLVIFTEIASAAGGASAPATLRLTMRRIAMALRIIR